MKVLALTGFAGGHLSESTSFRLLGRSNTTRTSGHRILFTSEEAAKSVSDGLTSHHGHRSPTMATVTDGYFGRARVFNTRLRQCKSQLSSELCSPIVVGALSCKPCTVNSPRNVGSNCRGLYNQQCAPHDACSRGFDVRSLALTVCLGSL